ncbi:MAG: Maf family protein [Bacillota bacterium]
MRLILASASPRREQLLRQIGLNFEVIPSQVDETVPAEMSENHGILVQGLALKKAASVARHLSNGLVIGADTIVVRNRDILGKPTSRAEAVEMLERLSGQSHHVFTGIALVDAASGRCRKAFQQTEVFFRQLSLAEIEAYVNTGEPMDKAGAYGIQGMGSLLIEKISGCYYNVVGLPLTKLAELLKEFGLWVL